MKFKKSLFDNNMTEKEYKDYIKTIDINKDTMEFILNSSKENIEQVINNKHIVFQKKVSIRLTPYSEIDENNNTMNAEVFINNERNFEITIYPKLIEELYFYARFAVSNKHIYKSINRSDENLSLLINSIVIFWLDFIFFHEYSHILLGHLDLDFIPNAKLLELNNRKDKKSISNKNLLLLRTIESEADSKAAELSFARFYLSKDLLYEKLNIECSSDEKVFTYIYTLSFLFEWFDDLEAGNNYKRTHPFAYERLLTCISFIVSLDSKTIINGVKIENVTNTSMEALLSYLIGKFKDKNKAINIIIDWFKSIPIIDKNLKNEINEKREKLEIKGY